MSEETPQAPDEIYATFSGIIDSLACNRILNSTAEATRIGVKHIHLLFHSHGGSVADGVALYNYFRALPIDLTLYNVGTVASSAVIAYLGAKNRRTSIYGSFMIHRTTIMSNAATTERLQALANNVIIEDTRTEAILRSHITLSEANWDVHRVADFWLNAQDAITAGIADGIGEFSPPLGTKIFSV